MKQLFVFALSLLLLLCCGCSAEPAQAETASPDAVETVSGTKAPQTAHTHTFGDWEAVQTQIQRLCAACGETELRDMTGEEQFYSLLRGHWEPYEVTFLEDTRLVYYLRNNVWYVYADYAGGDTLTYSSALTEDMLTRFSKHMENPSLIFQGGVFSGKKYWKKLDI